MSTIPLEIINQRAVACLGTDGGAACPEHEGGLTCGRIGDIRFALKSATIGLCPLGKHADAAARIETPKPAVPIRERIRVGAWWLLTYALRLCPATSAIVRFRRSQCATCEHRGRIAGVLSACRQCGCMTRPKTAIAAQACPVGRWAAEKTTGCKSVATLPVVGRALKPAGKGCGCGG